MIMVMKSEHFRNQSGCFSRHVVLYANRNEAK
ncbi:hypothetical protein [Ralstonia phage p2110]|nr:hypothetical protein [Ralstonia phage RPZH3]WAX26348.1 hypothetical protein [Ralstonia phage p2110]WRQ05470.1 hypothetical protein [Ralstonia phage AhaGv]